MTESQPKTAPKVADSKVSDSDKPLPTTNPPRLDPLPADATPTLPDGSVEQGAAALQKVIQEQRDKVDEQGHRGTKPPNVPKENYTVAGVTAGLPTPETVVRQEG